MEELSRFPKVIQWVLRRNDKIQPTDEPHFFFFFSFLAAPTAYRSSWISSRT